MIFIKQILKSIMDFATATGKNSKEWHYFKLQLTSQDAAADEELTIDEMTWRQFINNALKKSHGLFGEGCEFYFINQQNTTAYIKVFHKDADKFSSAVSTFISDEELVGLPLVVHIIQVTKALGNLQVEDSDLIWLKNAVREESEDADYISS